MVGLTEVCGKVLIMPRLYNLWPKLDICDEASAFLMDRVKAKLLYAFGSRFGNLNFSSKGLSISCCLSTFPRGGYALIPNANVVSGEIWAKREPKGRIVVKQVKIFKTEKALETQPVRATSSESDDSDEDTPVCM